MGAFSFLNKEIAIDLGTANTIIIYNDKVVVDEPSIVAIDRDKGSIMAVGKRSEIASKSLIFPAMIEFYALLGLVVSILLFGNIPVNAIAG